MQKCYKAEQPITHIVAGYTILAPSEYTDRHNKVAGYSHWTVCKHMELQVTDKYCEHRQIPKNGYKCQEYHYYIGCTSYNRLNNTSKLT